MNNEIENFRRGIYIKKTTASKVNTGKDYKNYLNKFYLKTPSKTLFNV